MKQVSARLFVWGLFALGLGALIYIVLRPEGSSYLNRHLSFYVSLPLLPFFNALPSLFHVLAFSLVSISISSRKYAFYICLFWFVFNMAFELLQHPRLFHFEFPGVLEAYAKGTFDYLDILASVIGAGLAFGVSHFLERGHDVQN